MSPTLDCYCCCWYVVSASWYELQCGLRWWQIYRLESLALSLLTDANRKLANHLLESVTPSENVCSRVGKSVSDPRHPAGVSKDYVTSKKALSYNTLLASDTLLYRCGCSLSEPKTAQVQSVWMLLANYDRRYLDVLLTADIMRFSRCGKPLCRKILTIQP